MTRKSDMFFLYRTDKDGFSRIGKGRSPPELEEKYDVLSIMAK